MTSLQSHHNQLQKQSNNRAYSNFIHSLKSPATKRMYIFSLDKYMLHHGIKTIDDLLENRHSPSKIEEQIIDWIVFLRTGGGGDPTNNNNFITSLRTRQLYLAAILAFYEINDVVLRKKKIAKFLGSEEEGTIKKHKKDRAYTTEEIRKLLDHADIRNKVIVLLLATTGMRLGALSELKLKHLKKIPEYNLYQVTVYENTKDEHYTFCTSECAKAIDDYLQYRRKCGERIDVEEGNAPVIRERFDRIDIEITKKAAESITTGGIGEILDVLLARAGLTEVRHSTELQQIRRGSERKAVKRAHGFRKFFNTNLVRAKVNFTIKERFLGHSIGLDGNYLRLNEEEILQEYLKAVDYLTINNEHRLQRKVVELTQKQDDIELMKVEQRRKDLELREQMQQQQQQYKRMIEEFQERDRKEKEELRREVMGYFKATRILVDLPEQEETAATAAMKKKSNKAYYLQEPEDTETKETLKKAKIRAAKQLRKDTLARHSHTLRSINNRIQQQHGRKNE